MKINLLLLPLLSILLTVAGYSQKQANIWYFGNHAGLDFSSGHPVKLEDGQLNTLEGCATISDKDGHLLFYSDGIKVWNKNHQLMKYTNGSLANNLKGDSSSAQSGVIVPNPSNPDIYYLFTVGTRAGRVLPNQNPGLNYYTVDVSKNSGLGEITAGPTNLSGALSPNWSEKITAVQGNDCGVIWVLSIVRDTFKAYKIEATGVNTVPVSSPVNYTLKSNAGRGYLTISPNGKKVALADWPWNLSNVNKDKARLVLFDFNATTGIMSPTATLLTDAHIDNIPYGVAFSKKSTKLYASMGRYNSTNILQFDLTAPNIAGTKATISSMTLTFPGALQLAVDGKIYVSTMDKHSLDTIENPDADSGNIRYTKNAVNLGIGTAQMGLPPFIQSYFISKDEMVYQQCDFDANPTDGFMLFDLKSKIPELSANAIGVKVEFFKSRSDLNHNLPITNLTSYKNTVAKQQKLIVKITNPLTGCYQKGSLTLKVVDIKILISKITIDNSNDPEDNAITVIVKGTGDYEYSIGGGEFINPINNLKHTFSHLKTGVYNIAVRDKNGCGAESSREVSVIYSPRFFTPNNDGYSDTWKLLGVNNLYYRSVNIQIFDRYERILAILNKTTNQKGWDGRYNGNPLPASDYWYKAMLIDKNGNTIKKLGYFSLIKK